MFIFYNYTEQRCCWNGAIEEINIIIIIIKKSQKIRVDYGSGWVGKVVSYYDLSVLSMSVMGFQKKSLDGGGWVGGVTSIQFYFGFLELFLTLQSPLATVEKCKLEK